MYTLSFEEATDREKRIGGKAMNLVKMKKHDLPVPDGFIVTIESLFHSLRESGLSTDDARDMEEKMKSLVLPEALANELKVAFEKLMKVYPAVAVRSSASSEDLEDASFAGQYESYLNVTSFEDLLDKIKDCWRSMFAPQVRHYAKNMNMPEVDWSMGVVVQGLVHSDVSGVVFSANPLTESTNEMVINASFGLGEAVVSGIVTPDLFIVNKDSLEIKKELGLKEIKIIPDGAGTKEIETTEEEQSRFCLSDAQVKQIAEMTKKVEDIYNAPIDLEFGLQGNELFVLQVRPITTLLRR